MISQFRSKNADDDVDYNIQKDQLKDSSDRKDKINILQVIIAIIRKIYERFRNLLVPKVYHPTTLDLLEIQGFKGEEHEIMTKDGYILTMHRILTPPSTKRNGKSVFFMHGAMLTSEIFVCKSEDGAKKSNLALQLSQQGYDVWLGNRRGNRYSKRHYLLTEDDEQFWNFSMDETVDYDIPSQINYIKSNHLTLVGFSQGSAEIFAFLSKNTEITNIKSFVALSATAKPNPLCKWLHRCPESLLYLVFGRSSFLSKIVPFTQGILTPHRMVRVLDWSIGQLFNWKMQNIPKREKTKLYRHLYSTTSVKQIIHWFSIIKKQRFHSLGDGEEYLLNKIAIPVLLVWGTNDSLIDVAYLKKKMPHSHLLPLKEWEHLDPIWATKVGQLVNRRVEKFIKSNK